MIYVQYDNILPKTMCTKSSQKKKNIGLFQVASTFTTDVLSVSWGNFLKSPEVDTSSVRCRAIRDCTVPRLMVSSYIGMTVWRTWYIRFLLNLYEIWNEQCIYCFFCVTFFLESWNCIWLQAPPLQEHLDLVKFWARSKLFHSEKGNDLAFRMSILNQSNASKLVVASLLRLETAHDFLSLLPFAKRFASHP